MSTYTAHVIDTANKLHSIRVESATHIGVKAAARKIAKSQRIEVRYIESIYING